MSKRSLILLTAFMLAIMAIQSVVPPHVEAQTTSTWSTQLTAAASGVRYGYTHNRYGSVTDRDFVLDDHTYVLYALRWNQSQERVEIYWDDCIKASEFVSLQLGTSTYSNPDYIDESDERCAFNRNRYQTFYFEDETTNPLPAGQTISVQITMLGDVPAPPPPSDTDHWDATIGSRRDNNADHYGYEYSDFGTISDRTFVVSDHTFEIHHIKWDESDQDVEIRLNDCLKPTEFVSLRLGTTTFSDPDYAFKTSSYCNDNRDSYQIFRFDDVSTNPLPSGRQVSVRITYAGDADLPANTANRWSTYLDSVQDNNDDEYGYHASDFGSIDDRTFDFDGTEYTIRYLKWEDASNDIQFYLRECLKESEVESLVLGGTTFSAPDTARNSDATCENNRSYDQILKWQNVSTNPLPAGQRLAVTLNFSDAPPAPLPTVATPSRPTLGTVTTSSIGISWGAVTGAGSYQVRHKLATASSSSWSGPHNVSSGRVYTATGLLSGREYEFQVRATGNGTTHNSSTWSGWSSSRKATTTSAPGVPTNGSATVDASDGSLDLSWTAPSGGAATYHVNIRSGTFSYSRTNITVTSHSIPGTSLSGISGSQTARVKACNAQGNCGAELSISFRPPAPAPANLRSTGTTTDSVTLSWGSVTGVTGYEHDYRKASETTWSDVDRSTTATSRIVSGLECGIEYVFRVRAHGNGTTYFSQWGPWSAVARATTAGSCVPSAPRNVALAAGNRQITVTWDTPEHNGGAAIDAYKVRWMADDASQWSYNTGQIFDPRSYVITNMNNGTSYDVEVQARNSETPPESGAWSEAESATPIAPAVTAPILSPATDGIALHSITFQWPAVSGATKYQVQSKLSTEDWPEVDDNAPGQSSLSFEASNLDAGTNYHFRVRAYGNGTTHSASWGDWSGDFSASTLTNECVIQILGTISESASRQSRWSNRCESSNRPNKYAKHFSFTLASASTVTIELVSSTNPYLFLMSDQGTSGTVVAENDDSGDNELGQLNSRIIYAAAAGTYTAEATTFSSGATGDLTIEISVPSTMPTNAPPAFGSSTYTFSVDEDEANGHTVGTVAATDSDGTVASYSLDDTSLFNISNAGAISVAASLEGQGDEPPASLTVTATDNDGDTDTATVSITVDDVLPSEPRNVVLTPGHAQINVAWTEPESNGGASIDGYRVRHRATTATAWNYSQPITASPYDITNLTNGTTYQVEVQARNNLQPPEFGHWSNVQTAIPVASTLPAVDAPTTPTKTAATSSSISISWTAVTGAAKYQVRYKTGTNAWNTVEVANGTRYTAEMLDAMTTYRFEVSAYGNGTTHRAAWSGWSTHLDAATNVAPTVSGCTTSLGSISGESSYEGSWTSDCVSTNRVGRYARYFTFELEAAAELTIELVSETDPYLYLMDGAGTSGTELAKNDDSHDNDLGFYNSRITYQADAGSYTAEATTLRRGLTDTFTFTIGAALRLPSAPRNVRVVPGNNRLVVLWDPPASDGGSPITGYRVDQEAASGSSGSQTRSRRDIVDPTRLLGADDRGYAILNLANGTSYSVTVKAVNANGEGAAATGTATPQATTITVTAPGSLEFAAPGVVGVQTTNTVTGAGYKVRLSIDDETKVSFGGCDPQDDVEILSGLTSTTIVQACSVGTANVTALLVVQDAQGVYQPLSASAPHEITVTSSTATLVMEVALMSDSPEEFEIGESAQLDISATSLATDTPYYIEVNSTDSQGVGFDQSCGLANRVLPSETSGSDTSAMQTVDIYACGSLADGEITAELKRGGVVVDSASLGTSVKPAQPSALRANGKGSAAGKALLRFDPDSRSQTYKIQSKGSDGAWNEQNDPYGSDRFGYRTIGNRRIFELEIDLNADQEYGVKVQAVRTDRGQSLPSEWSEEVYIWVAQSERLPDTQYSQALTNGWTYKICPGESAGSGFGLNASTDFANWSSDIEGAIDSWEDKVIWTKPDGSNIISASSSGTGDCADGSEYTNNIVKGIDDHRMMRMTCFQDAWDDPSNRGAVACAGGETPTSLTKLMIFWTGWTQWNPGAGTDSGCSLVTWSAAHEAGHVFGFADHLDDDAAILDTLPPFSVCEPGPRDVMALMSLYQSVGN